MWPEDFGLDHFLVDFPGGNGTSREGIPNALSVEDGMLEAFGAYAAVVGLVLVMWFIHVGFLVKKILKEQQETNRILRQLCSAGSGLGTDSKAE